MKEGWKPDNSLAVLTVTRAAHTHVHDGKSYALHHLFNESLLCFACRLSYGASLHHKTFDSMLTAMLQLGWSMYARPGNDLIAAVAWLLISMPAARAQKISSQMLPKSRRLCKSRSWIKILPVCGQSSPAASTKLHLL